MVNLTEPNLFFDDFLQMSRISEATEHLDPSNIQEISFSDVTDSSEDSNTGKTCLTYLMCLDNITFV